MDWISEHKFMALVLAALLILAIVTLTRKDSFEPVDLWQNASDFTADEEADDDDDSDESDDDDSDDDSDSSDDE